MTQLTIDAALDSLVMNNQPWLQTMRDVARLICRDHGAVSTDDLRVWADETGIQPDSDHAWGCIWKEKGWRFVEWTQSTYCSNHNRRIAVWRWEA